MRFFRIFFISLLLSLSLFVIPCFAGESDSTISVFTSESASGNSGVSEDVTDCSTSSAGDMFFYNLFVISLLIIIAVSVVTFTVFVFLHRS